MTVFRTMLISACASVTLGGAAMAMPAKPAPMGSGAAQVELAAQGCGPGWVRNRWGECRPMGGPGYGPPPPYGYGGPPPPYGFRGPPPPPYGYGYGPPPPRCFWRNDPWGRPVRVCR